MQRNHLVCIKPFHPCEVNDPSSVDVPNQFECLVRSERQSAMLDLEKKQKNPNSWFDLNNSRPPKKANDNSSSTKSQNNAAYFLDPIRLAPIPTKRGYNKAEIMINHISIHNFDLPTQTY